MSRRIRSGLTPTLALLSALALLWTCSVSNAQTQATKKAAPASKAAAPQHGKTFSTAEEAATALRDAARNNDENAMMLILGPGSKEVVAWTDDAAQRQDNHRVFVEKYEQMHRLVREPDGTMTLYVGAENWPMPIPLVERNGAWFFDLTAGKREMLYRRVGQNELMAMAVGRELVSAEKEFFATAHQYTEKFESSGGQHDGLHWDGDNCPIGPYLAHAGAGEPNHVPFHGYYYRVVLAPNAEGGFAVVAYPAEYRSSGVMTFLTERNGVVYEKNLGLRTGDAAQKIGQPQPDNTWKRLS